MRIVTVQATIKSESLRQFLDASSANGRSSVRTESGCQRFEVFHDSVNPLRIGFTEIYDDDAALAAHGETEHFSTWLNAVDGLDEGDMIFATCRGLTVSKPPTGNAQTTDTGSAVGGRHILQGRTSVSAGDADALSLALLDQAATALSDERGCLRFDVGQSLEDPAEFWVSEVYADHEAYVDHRAAAHTLSFFDDITSRFEPSFSWVSGPNVWPPDDSDWAG
jgi:autoinducer 2-degrading protein